MKTLALDGQRVSMDVLLELSARYKLRQLVEAVVVRTGPPTQRVRLSAIAERCAQVLKVPGGTLFTAKVRRAMNELGWGRDLVVHHNVPLLKGAQLR